MRIYGLISLREREGRRHFTQHFICEFTKLKAGIASPQTTQLKKPSQRSPDTLLEAGAAGHSLTRNWHCPTSRQASDANLGGL